MSKSKLNLASVAKLALLGSALLTLLVCVSRIVYPHDLSVYEADRWAPADLIAHGHSPYYKSLATNPPYVVAPYGPLYYGLVAIGARLFGDQFAFGRTLGVVALIAVAVLVYVIVKRFVPRTSSFVPLLGAGLVL